MYLFAYDSYFHTGVMLVGFCELNNWQDLESYTDLFKNKVQIIFTTLFSIDNFWKCFITSFVHILLSILRQMKIAYRAANAGFAYSHIMVNSQV